MIETSLQNVISCLAAGRCYACGWPLAAKKEDGCVPFNCAMRYKDGTQHLAEKERWHERATEMNNVLGWAVGKSTEALRPEAVAIVQRHRRHVELSPGAGEEVQRYALAVCDDILSDLGCTMNKEKQ